MDVATGRGVEVGRVHIELHERRFRISPTHRPWTLSWLLRPMWRRVQDMPRLKVHHVSPRSPTLTMMR